MGQYITGRADFRQDETRVMLGKQWTAASESPKGWVIFSYFGSYAILPKVQSPRLRCPVEPVGSGGGEGPQCPPQRTADWTRGRRHRGWPHLRMSTDLHRQPVCTCSGSTGMRHKETTNRAQPLEAPVHPTVLHFVVKHSFLPTCSWCVWPCPLKFPDQYLATSSQTFTLNIPWLKFPTLIH